MDLHTQGWIFQTKLIFVSKRTGLVVEKALEVEMSDQDKIIHVECLIKQGVDLGYNVIYTNYNKIKIKMLNPHALHYCNPGRPYDHESNDPTHFR
jgi:hypothetical protein